MVHRWWACVVLVALAAQGALPGPKKGLPECEWCGTSEAPADLSSVMEIAVPDEPGRRIVLRGQVFAADGRTPAASVLVYAYHTDETGIYRRDGHETGNGLRHGALRGWLRTDEEGRYEIRTILPGAYPGRSAPAHIHVTLEPENGPERWVDSFNFAGDPLLRERDFRRSTDLGRFGFVVTLEEHDGMLVGRRDLRVPVR